MSKIELNFYYKKENGVYRVYNSTKDTFSTIKSTELYKLKKRYSLLVGYEATDKSLKQFADDFEIWVSQFKNNDLFKFDYIKYKSHEQACVEMFKKLCHGLYDDMEDIGAIEYSFIEACNNSGLRYCKAGKYNCYGYDFSSQFPSILASYYFEIPTKTGKLFTLNEIVEKEIVVGFYTVKITSNDERFNKIFAYSKEHVYTHISLQFALACQKEGYDISIKLVDKENNCYLYGKGKKDGITSGEHIFKKWYQYLFGLKEKFPANKLIKFLTSALWGRLCEHDRLFKTFDQMVEENIDVVPNYDINHDYYIRNVKYNRKGEEIYELVNCKKPYYFNIARVKPFLLAKSRAITGKVAMSYIDDVVRICVDNVTFSKQHDDVMFSKNTYKLVNETKTTGLIEFKHCLKYKHFDNEIYTTKNYKKDDLDDDILEDYEI